uniref:Uncharacterized protein n=1 Tax=Anguilla anguilla TaxID=7936 RepID=A0A0E9VA44_ANGAN
MQPTNAFNVQ